MRPRVSTWVTIISLLFLSVLLYHKEIRVSTSKSEDLDNLVESITGPKSLNTKLDMLNQTGRRARIREACGEDLDRTRVFAKAGHYYRWMFVSDKLKLIMCTIPKVASTFFKGISTWTPKVDQLYEQKGVQFSHINRPTLDKYEKGERRFRIRKYKRAIFVRHPLARLWSAYTSKIMVARDGYFENVGKEIISLFREAEVNDTMQCEPVVTFKEFTKYLIKSSNRGQEFDPHWASYKSLCHPCLMRYNFIGKLETYVEDINDFSDFAELPDELRYKAGNFNSSLQGLIGAACRLNTNPSCGTLDHIIQSNLQYLSVEGLIDMESDTSWIRQKISDWLKKPNFQEVKIYCMETFSEHFANQSPEDVIKNIKSRKRKVRDKAFQTISPVEMMKLKEIYEEDFKLFGYEDLNL